MGLEESIHMSDFLCVPGTLSTLVFWKGIWRSEFYTFYKSVFFENFLCVYDEIECYPNHFPISVVSKSSAFFPTSYLLYF